jgi:type I restriction enzyme S subunit
MKMQSVNRYEAYKDSGVEWLGDVPAHWQISRVKNLGLLSRGVDLARDVFKAGNYPVYGSNGIIGYHSEYTTKGPSLTVGRSGSVGEINFVQADFWAHNTALYLQENFNNDIRFIFYRFLSLNLQSFSAGSAVGTLNRNVIHQLVTAIPPFSEQQAIAAYLDTQTAQIDRKIELLSQKASQYGKLKQSLINETVTRGLDKTVPMKHSGVEWIGEVPAHWEVKRLKDINNIIMGQSPSSSDYTDQNQGYPFLQGNAEFGHYSPIPKVWCSVIKKFAVKNDVLLSVRAPVGAVNVAEDSYGIGRGLCAIRTKSNHQFWYYFSKTITAYLNSIATGSTYLAVSVEDVRNTMVILPSNQEQLSISNYLDEKTAHIDRIIATINSQIDKLKELRLTLINDAVTGKIKVA